MRVEQERRVLALFDAMLDEPEADRAAWLARATGDDPALAAAVLALAAADHRSALLPTAPPGPQAGTVAAPPPPERLGNYRLGPEIGRGGMGVVYLAERDDGLFEQRVAIKLIRAHVTPRAAAAFDAERRALARIEHPGVARLIDGGVAPDGRPWLATEHVAGTALDQACEGLALPARLRLFLAAARAVQFAHARLVAHGDVKPANVLVAEDGRVALLDFGVARLIGADAAGDAAFTPGFASPERVAGAAPSVADDVHALGRTLGIVAGDGADRELRAIVARAIAAEPARYPSAAALVDDVERWLDGRPVAAVGRGGAYAARKFVRRHRLAVAAALAALAALAASALVATRNYVRAEHARAAEALRFADAHRAARYLMFTLLDRLEQRPGTLRLRAQVGQVAQVYLDRLAASADAPREVRLDVARGYLREAGMAGMGNAPNFGDTDRAERDLARARTMLAALAREAPGWPPLAAPLARAASLTCQTSLYAGHDAARALAAARHGLAQVAAAVPDAAARDVAGWPVRVCAGDALVWLDRAGEAVPMLEREATARRPPDPAMLERTLRILGEAYFYAARYPDAERVLLRAAAIQADAHARAPFHGPAAIEAANVADDLASTYGAMGRYADQLRVARAALALVGRQAGLDPDDVQSARRALSMMRLVAGALARLGRPAEGAALMLRADARWATMARSFPHDSATARLRLLALQVTGDLQRRSGARAAACATYRAAAAGWESFGNRWRLSPSDARETVAATLRDVAACAGHGGFVDG